MKRLSVVFFNAGGTLLQLRNTNLPNYYSELLSSITGKEVSADQIYEAFRNADNWVLSQNKVSLFSDLDQRKYQSIFYGTLGIKNRKLINRIELELAEQIQLDYVLEENAKELLQSLREKYKLGIISNWDDSLIDILEDLDIYDYFDSITYSEDVGVNKPDLEIFRSAISDFPGVKAKETVYIGDNYEEDILPAMKIKMNVILFDKGSTGLHGYPFRPQVNCPRVSKLDEVRKYL
ncbi:MAG: HAD family hydrolase [Candidatus Hodarchaeales archaeon]